jgi:peptide/nickel transport system permease protein
MAPIIVIGSKLCFCDFSESGLSFGSRGATANTSWGSIIKDHYSYIILGKPYLAMVPGIAINTLAFMMMGMHYVMHLM